MFMNTFLNGCVFCTDTYIPRNGTAGPDLRGPHLFTTFEEPPKSFPKGLHPFTCPPATWEGSGFSPGSLIPINLVTLFFFCIFRATSTAHGSSQARCQIRVIAAGPDPTATATWDPSHVCDLHHGSWQHRILNPLSEARNRTCILMDTYQVRYH